MRCEVLLFAHLRDALGCDRLTLELPANATVGEALNRLSDEHAAIAAMQGRLAVAVNQQYRPLTATLSDNCVLAIIPPVSGG